MYNFNWNKSHLTCKWNSNQAISLKQFRLWQDSNPFLPDTSWALLMSEKVRVQTVCLQFASAFIESIKVSYYNEQFTQKKN